MSWEVDYTYRGHICGMSKATLESRLEDLQQEQDNLWRQLIAMAAMTPPHVIKTEDEEGAYSDYYPEYLSRKMDIIRTTMEDNSYMINHIKDCLEAIKQNPEEVTEG